MEILQFLLLLNLAPLNGGAKVSFAVVAGGGGGAGDNGTTTTGGGAGGFRENKDSPRFLYCFTISGSRFRFNSISSTYPITVGGGAAGGAPKYRWNKWF